MELSCTSMLVMMLSPVKASVLIKGAAVCKEAMGSVETATDVVSIELDLTEFSGVTDSVVE